jgi:hypothetical protein
VWKGEVAAISRPIQTTEKRSTTGAATGGAFTASEEAISSLWFLEDPAKGVEDGTSIRRFPYNMKNRDIIL